ncbi:MAG TPA: malto-oligosyltrehalose trehalohydrolase [Candidatus Acidoferrum sp.]|nr:malto-oligosyltrehalose trehalohydrolase [Candidatus Acidoferrum sp.]
MNYSHEMPFGAAMLEGGLVRFRLWAPKAHNVCLNLGSSSLPMVRSTDGWFELTREAPHGAHYHFKIAGSEVPDPASRYQPLGIHGPSEVIDPRAFEWKNGAWMGRPWEEAVLYELHVGTFSAEGTFAAAQRKLDYLAGLGITAIEIMPVSSFPGKRNWGYDGVLPYAPTACYGRPEDFKRFIDAAHSRELMVFLDVVYNHFGPEGNYLSLYCPQFFTECHKTPWGPAINFDGPGGRTVRDYFIHNALYWLEEYRLDGLRFDAVHAIYDESRPDLLTELAETARSSMGCRRLIHLVLENDHNAARYLRRSRDNHPVTYDGQWNDDIHHAAHVQLTGESDGYYADYSSNAIWHFGRCLAEGYSYQGEPSPFRGGEPRGEASSDLPPSCFVSFLQNHDQIGNRAFGERITSLAETRVLKAVLAALLLAPSPPLLFMGEEFAASTPFLFFCDFGADLAKKIREGRRAEFARFAQFSSPQAQSKIPDPTSEETFQRSKLDWVCCVEAAMHANWLSFYRDLLALRRKEIMPRIRDILPGKARFEVLAPKAVLVEWPLQNGGALTLVANFSGDGLQCEKPVPGSVLYATFEEQEALRQQATLPPFATAWFVKP